jgi:hypothetical protein
MSWYRDLDTQTMVATGDHVRAIGWLSSTHYYTHGEVSAEFLARLRDFVRRAGESAEALYFPAFGGFHTCELCEEVHDGRDFGVPAGDLLYVAPGMVAHYVAHHGYQPPAEFVAAVMDAPLPGTDKYRAAVREFGRRHVEWWQALLDRQRIAAEPARAQDCGGDNAIA